MTEVKYKNATINIPDSWDEITFKQYLEFSKVSETIKDDDDSIENTLKTFKMVEIITNSDEETIDKLSINEMNELSLKVSEFIKGFKLSDNPSDHFTIDGVDYVAKNINELDNGEYISINLLRERHKTNDELFPRMLAVLIRPGTMEYDRESKKELWTPLPFNRKDILNLELRADILLNKGYAKDLVPVLNFFLNTIKESV